MDNAREYSPEMRRLLEARSAPPPEPAPVASELDLLLEALSERFHPDRVNAQLWHCRTKEEFDREWDALQDPEDDLTARPDQDGGNDTFFSDRN